MFLSIRIDFIFETDSHLTCNKCVLQARWSSSVATTPETTIRHSIWTKLMCHDTQFIRTTDHDLYTFFVQLPKCRTFYISIQCHSNKQIDWFHSFLALFWWFLILILEEPWMVVFFFNFHIFPLVNFDQDTRTQVMRWENTKVAFVKCAVATIILAFVKRHQILSSNSDRCHTTDWLIMNYLNHYLLASFIIALRLSIAHKLYQMLKFPRFFSINNACTTNSVLQMHFFIWECYSLRFFYNIS